jgi:hypothetical protein
MYFAARCFTQEDDPAAMWLRAALGALCCAGALAFAPPRVATRLQISMESHPSTPCTTRRVLLGRAAVLGAGAAAQLAVERPAQAAQMPVIAPAPQEGDCAGNASKKPQPRSVAATGTAPPSAELPLTPALPHLHGRLHRRDPWDTCKLPRHADVRVLAGMNPTCIRQLDFGPCRSVAPPVSPSC